MKIESNKLYMHMSNKLKNDIKGLELPTKENTKH